MPGLVLVLAPVPAELEPEPERVVTVAVGFAAAGLAADLAVVVETVVGRVGRRLVAADFVAVAGAAVAVVFELAAEV